MSGKDREGKSGESHLTFADKISQMKNIISEYKNSLQCRESLQSSVNSTSSSSFLHRIEEYKKMLKSIDKGKLGCYTIICYLNLFYICFYR
jgi:hypothetical protein